MIGVGERKKRKKERGGESGRRNVIEKERGRVRKRGSFKLCNYRHITLQLLHTIFMFKKSASEQLYGKHTQERTATRLVSLCALPAGHNSLLSYVTRDGISWIVLVACFTLFSSHSFFSLPSHLFDPHTQDFFFSLHKSLDTTKVRRSFFIIIRQEPFLISNQEESSIIFRTWEAS